MLRAKVAGEGSNKTAPSPDFPFLSYFLFLFFLPRSMPMGKEKK